MLRGGAPTLAALLFCCLPVVSPAQAPVRTRDFSVAAVNYDNGLTLSALTLFELISLQRENSSTTAYGLLSLFHDGRWSMQGGLEGARRSAPIPTAPRFAPLFGSMRGEAALSIASTAQAGFMPTLQFSGHSRVYFDAVQHGGRVGASVARTFDGSRWQTAVLAEGNAWRRSGNAWFSFTATPMQLSVGDMVGDLQSDFEWRQPGTIVGSSFGIRLGEAQRGTVAWGSIAYTWPLREDLWTTVSAGSYPADLIQGLPGGNYFAMTVRLPGGRLPPLRLPPPPPPPEPVMESVDVTQPLDMVIGFALDSTNIREIRVWAPGIERVELMADFVNWVPVPLIRQPNGEWRGYYRVSPGLHRVNLRLNGKEIDVPTRFSRLEDEFLGEVGLVIVR